jgi:hypothetical protein
MAEMNPTSVLNESWKDLYRAALFELNKSKLSGRIADAEKTIAARGRELFNAGDHTVLERSELKVALYALVALRSSLHWKAKSDPSPHSAVA